MARSLSQFDVPSNTLSGNRMDVVVNANTNGLPVTINNPLPVTTVASEVNVQLASGQLTGYSYIEKFGSNFNIGSAIETVWDRGGKYIYPSVASVVYASSTSSNNSATGTGARTLEVQGLNALYEPISEIITIGGAPSILEFLRVFRAKVITAGSTGTNETSDVLISTQAAGAGIVVSSISGHGTGGNYAGLGQSFMALYTIPAGKTGYLTQLTTGIASAGNVPLHSYVRVRPYDNGPVFSTKDVMFTTAGYATKQYIVPLMLPEKMDIEVESFCSNTGGAVSATFNIVLVDNV